MHMHIRVPITDITTPGLSALRMVCGLLLTSASLVDPAL